MSNDEWAESVTKRAMEMAEMDPEMMPRINLILAKERLLKVLAGLVALFGFFFAAVVLPLVIIVWRAAL